MKSKRKSEKNPTTEFGNFSRLLDKLLAVPHGDIKAELDAEKERKKSAPKRRASSGHASGEKG